MFCPLRLASSAFRDMLVETGQDGGRSLTNQGPIPDGFAIIHHPLDGLIAVLGQTAELILR